jgi:SAM-dependent methyltransferase
MSEVPSSGSAYTFGEDSVAIQRLLTQSELLNPFTQRLLEDAGLGLGMRVLDVGCGPGDVSLIAARLVGETGRVLGVDTNAAALQVAHARAQTGGVKQVTFLAGDIHDVGLEDEWDAIVGRLILQHVTDPAALLRRLARRLRPGGLVAFQEYDLTGLSTVPPCPLWEQAGVWTQEAVQRAGLELRMGMKLYQTFLAAGLPAPQVRYEAAIGAGPTWTGTDSLADTVRVLLPLIVRLGVATADEVAIDTLADRLREELVSYGSVAHLSGIVSAWTHTTGEP